MQSRPGASGLTEVEIDFANSLAAHLEFSTALKPSLSSQGTGEASRKESNQTDSAHTGADAEMMRHVH